MVKCILEDWNGSNTEKLLAGLKTTLNGHIFSVHSIKERAILDRFGTEHRPLAIYCWKNNIILLMGNCKINSLFIRIYFNFSGPKDFILAMNYNPTYQTKYKIIIKDNFLFISQFFSLQKIDLEKLMNGKKAFICWDIETGFTGRVLTGEPSMILIKDQPLLIHTHMGNDGIWAKALSTLDGSLQYKVQTYARDLLLPCGEFYSNEILPGLSVGRQLIQFNLKDCAILESCPPIGIQKQEYRSNHARGAVYDAVSIFRYLNWICILDIAGDLMIYDLQGKNQYQHVLESNRSGKVGGVFKEATSELIYFTPFFLRKFW